MITIPDILIQNDMSPNNKPLESFLILNGLKPGKGTVVIDMSEKTAVQHEFLLGKELEKKWVVKHVYEWK